MCRSLCRLYFGLFNKRVVKKRLFTDNDIYVRVTDDYVNRLDKVAFDYYSNVSLWWVIAQASNIRNPFDIPLGTILRIPPMSTLFKIRGIDI